MARDGLTDLQGYVVYGPRGLSTALAFRQRHQGFSVLAVLVTLVVGTGCNPVSTATVPPPTNQPPAVVRACEYDPLVSVPAVMPVEVTDRTPDPVVIEQPANTPVDQATTQAQLGVFHELVDVINDDYIYIDLEGLDFPGLAAKYETLINGGLTYDDFYRAMDNLTTELGDGHSDFVDPAEVIELEEKTSGTASYVGVGVDIRAVPDTERAVIVFTFAGGSAGDAGIKKHDAVLKVDGQPILNDDGLPKVDQIRGPEGTSVTLTVQTPGGPARDITLERRSITRASPVDFCMVPRTSVAYIFLPTLHDLTIPQQMRDAMTTLTAAGPLTGLILDNRVNGGGQASVLTEVLALFVDGTPGFFVSRDDRNPLEIEGAEIGNSLDVPMVVLVDLPTNSFAEIMSGVLQNTGRAKVVGQNTLGNVEALQGYTFDDGSQAWIARSGFEPQGLDVGVWEETGIVPDVSAPTRWDLFTEASDPAFPVALDLLADQGVPVPSPLTP